MSARVVGRVAALNRYPVKSMAGERCEEAEIGWTGLRGDREYAFVFADRSSRFPWFTGRDLPELVLHRATAGPATEVRTPEGETLAIGDAALAAALTRRAGRPVQLLQLARGTYDAMPVSIVSTATLAAVDAAHGGPVDPDRFRINIVVDSPERDCDWREHVLTFGTDGLRLAVNRPIERCAMITIDPRTNARDPAIMRTVARSFGNEVGEYLAVLRPGVIRVGDAIGAVRL